MKYVPDIVQPVGDNIMSIATVIKQKGLEQGRAEGQQRSKFDIANNMKHNGFSIETTAKMTGLTINEIKCL